MTAGRGRSARGVCDLIPEGQYRCGDCHLDRAHPEEFGDLRAVGTFEGLRAFGTFEELEGTYQRGIIIISARWVYSWKSDGFGVVVRAKAKLIARGFGQREGIDFFDTFSRMVQ